MKFEHQTLIQELSKITQENIRLAQQYAEMTEDQLNQREAEGRWSILECLEHLNLYGDFYVPEITRALKKAKKGAAVFKSGWGGQYFAESMKPKEGMKTMNTFKDKNPFGSQLNKGIIQRFIAQQEQMLSLLEKAKEVNLNSVRTKITLPLLTFKLGDTFRFVIYHNQRHMVQAEKVKSNLFPSVS